MHGNSPIDLEARLQARYQTLVEQHSAPLSPLAAGLRALPDGGSAFAATQAAWRFYQNPKVTLPTLCQPLQDHVRTQVAGEDYVLIAHDWSWLDYPQHTRKTDRARTRNRVPGYELCSALAISATTGAPLAPVWLALESAEGVYTSGKAGCQPVGEGHQEALWAQVQQVEALNLPAPCVPIVDREADSVQQFRDFARAQQRCLIRAKEQQYVEVQGRRVRLRHLVTTLDFSATRSVLYHGQASVQWVEPGLCGLRNRRGGSARYNRSSDTSA